MATVTMVLPVTMLLIFVTLPNVSALCWFHPKITKKAPNNILSCINIDNLNEVLANSKFKETKRAIEIYNSNIPNVHGYAFVRFQKTLTSLDLRFSQILAMDPDALGSLKKLEILILKGNKLQWVQSAWFNDLANLKTVDFSFNSIDYIELDFFTKVPKLETLYLDNNELKDINWNSFSLLENLKEVTIGKNPWGWFYRAELSRVLETRNVDFRDDFDDWFWMYRNIWTCMELSNVLTYDESVLDCAIAKLLDLTFENVGRNITITAQCSSRAQELMTCSRNGVSKEVAMRKVMMGFAEDLKRIIEPSLVFSIKSGSL